MTESPTVRQQRQEHERLLEKVGVETEAGQELLARWAAEERRQRRRMSESDLFRAYGVKG